MKIKIFAGIFLLGLSLFLTRATVRAAEDYSQDMAGMTEDILEQFDFEEIDEELKELFPEQRVGFKETIMEILSGDIMFTSDLLKRLVIEQLTYAIKSCRQNLVHILFLAVMAAVFANFGSIFQSRQISEVSFFVLYLLMIALCLNSFKSVVEWTTGGIESLTSFMKVFCPVYFLAVTIAKGSITAAAFYNLALFLILVVELLIVKLLLPLVHVYMMIKILDFLSPEEYLSKFAELIETAVSWTLKTLLTCIIGLNVMQSLISPAVDTVKRSVVTRGAEAIPGIGDVLGGMTEVVFGTAVLVKNGIGMTGAVICFALCLFPLVQIGCIVLMYKLAAALIQPVSDKRIVGCVESVGEGCRLLMRIIFTSGLLFLLTIVVVSASTGNV
ncbi:MAG: stage III sporulation protein AF [Dorea sp.]|nr:stage III sporulation protein AF [Dorea sp.]